MDQNLTAVSPQVDPPNGVYSAKVDEKGRLKLSASMFDYLKKLDALKVFVTTTDQVTGKIYTTRTWAENRKLLQNLPPEKKAWGKQVLFLANDMGADAEIDEQGRMLVPMEMREKLGIHNSKVYLEAGPGLISIYSEKVYQEQRQRALENLPEKVEYLESIGLL